MSTRVSVLSGLTAVMLLVAASEADAQRRPRAEVVTVGLNGGIQGAGPRFDDRFEFEEFVETGTVATAYALRISPSLEGSIGVRLWRRVGFGLAVSRFGGNGSSARVDARIPHPFFDEQHRAVSGESGGLTRAETAVHLQVTYSVDPAGPLSVVFSAGPSFVSATQALVTGVRYAEAYPYETATFVGTESDRVSRSATGFNTAADVIWMLGPRFGVGGLVRYSRASISFDPPARRAVNVHSGGIQAAAGVRLKL